MLISTLSFTEITSWGVLYYAFTVFLAPMGADLGWSRAAMTGAFSLALLLSGLMAVPCGRWLDRHGPRLMMTAGSCAAALLVLAWANVTNLAVFYLVWAAIGVTMAFVLYEPAFVAVATWFGRRRGRALTALTFVAGFASVIYIPLAGRLVQAQGWRGALVTLAALLAVLTIAPHALVLRPAPVRLPPEEEPPDRTATGSHARVSVTMRAAIRQDTFWWLTAAFCLNAMGQIALFVHLVPYLIGQGTASATAAGVTGVIGALALPGRLVFTPLGDRIPRSIVTAAIFAMQAAALVALLVAPAPAGIVGFVALFGIGFGAITPARAALVAEYYGAAHYGSISGVLALCITLARAIGPLAAGASFDASASYRPFFWALVVLSSLAAACVLVAERRAGQTLLASRPGAAPRR
ncbi:MAG: MFS transporter [Dehalococcoidia bacterium]